MPGIMSLSRCVGYRAPLHGCLTQDTSDLLTKWKSVPGSVGGGLLRESVMRRENTAEYWREAKHGYRHDFMKQSLCVDLVTQLIQSFTWHFNELLLLASPTWQTRDSWRIGIYH